MKIAVFHYHLHPGGVTRVITLAAEILLSRLTEIEEIVIVSGDRKNTSHIMSRIREAVPEAAKTKIRIEIRPEIGYVEESGPPAAAAEIIKDRVLGGFRSYLWWIHNYHLGKNPLFTRAVLEAAREFPDQKILFHIHDFPECSRYGNLSFLRSFYPDSLYPLYRNVRYVCINQRDTEFLIESGIPPKMVRRLDNPLTEFRPERPRQPRNRVKRILEEKGAGIFPGYLPDRPLMLYPVRSIRRKNVLEAGLLSRLIEGGMNIAVTLPGTSRQEAPYSQLVEKCFIEGRIHGIFGSGAPDAELGISLDDLIRDCDGVISTSVQEGFGYLFINTVQWGKKLIARDLDVLSGLKNVFSNRYHCFYDEIRIPRGRARQDRTLKRYLRFLDGLTPYLGKDLVLKVSGRIEQKFKEDVIDFSYLAVDEQCEVLENTADHAFLKMVRTANSGLTGSWERLLEPNAPGPDPVPLPNGFGPDEFAESAGSIISSFNTEMPYTSGISPMPEIDKNMLEMFASPPFLRLLFASYNS